MGLRKFEDRPVGEWDRAGRWYPDEQEEKASCCNKIRTPSRAFGKSLWKHCQTQKHYEVLCTEKGEPFNLPEREKVKRNIPEMTGYKALIVKDGKILSNYCLKKLREVSYIPGKWYKEKVEPSLYTRLNYDTHPTAGYFFYDTPEKCHDYMANYGVDGEVYQGFQVTARYFEKVVAGKYVCSMIRIDDPIHPGELFPVPEIEEDEN